MSGAGGINKEKDGTLILSGTNTFSGDVAINGGELILRGGSHTGLGVVRVAKDAGTSGTSIIDSGATVSTANDKNFEVASQGGTSGLTGYASVEGASTLTVGRDLLVASFTGADNNGTLNIAGGSTVNASLGGFVGAYGTGTIIVDSSNITDASSGFYIGGKFGGTGTGFVSLDNSSNVFIDGNLEVGPDGTGGLEVKGGSSFTINNSSSAIPWWLPVVPRKKQNI